MKNTHATATTRTAGFSLVELLAAIAILMVIVGIMGMVFTESDRAWNVGTGRVTNMSEGRAALNMIAHDLQYAVADKTLTFRLRPDKDGVRAFGAPCDELSFVSLQHDSSESPRTAREIAYYVVVNKKTDPSGRLLNYNYQLLRQDVGDAISESGSADAHSYKNRSWWESRVSGTARSVLSENVASFTVYAAPNSAAPKTAGDLTEDYDSAASSATSNQLPWFVDICLELLNERDALQAARMATEFGSDADQRVVGFVQKSVRRYTTRVYFQNRAGYEER